MVQNDYKNLIPFQRISDYETGLLKRSKARVYSRLLNSTYNVKNTPTVWFITLSMLNYCENGHSILEFFKHLILVRIESGKNIKSIQAYVPRKEFFINNKDVVKQDEEVPVQPDVQVEVFNTEVVKDNNNVLVQDIEVPVIPDVHVDLKTNVETSTPVNIDEQIPEGAVRVEEFARTEIESYKLTGKYDKNIICTLSTGYWGRIDSTGRPYPDAKDACLDMPWYTSYYFKLMFPSGYNEKYLAIALKIGNARQVSFEKFVLAVQGRISELDQPLKKGKSKRKVKK